MSREDGADLHLFGIRHHGPGSARSLIHALERLDPDIVLIEGPPDADDLLPLAGRDDLRPPVAILVHADDAARGAVFYPFATFSPEWQAIRYALAHGTPVRFIDLPQSIRFGSRGTEQAPDAPADDVAIRVPDDPLEPLAKAAGFGDAERWWDHLVESRHGDDLDVFAAVHEMMTLVRTELAADTPLDERRREAWMRRSIRAARTEGFSRIAVVCGAFHTPALSRMPPARDDDAVLKGLRRVRTSAAWVPWSYERLSFVSGYGAGIESPIWYELLFEHRSALGASWVGRAARLLREEDVPVSSAHVIEACRLADALAAVRGRPLPGLVEYNDAALTVLGAGDAGNLRLIGRRWHYDDRLGTVPDDFPAAPLQRDLAAQQKRLRLPPKAEERELDLDLRETIDRERSHLLRRLRLLDIDWGVPDNDGPVGRGTFRERWRVRWQPDFAVSLIEASRDGHTVETASASRVVRRASDAKTDLQSLVRLLEDALFADLSGAVPPLVTAIENASAVNADVLQLLDALPPLVSVHRYGNVRQTDVTLVAEILRGLLPRVFVGLPLSASGIDDDAAREVWRRMKAGEAAIRSLADPAFSEGWLDAAGRIATSDSAHGLLSGYAHRLLYDGRALDFDGLAGAMARALSPANAPAQAAAWVEGLLAGSSAFLIHDDRLRSIVDNWIRHVADDQFVQVLPLLRRTFAGFPAAERRLLGERLRPSSLAGQSAMDAAADGSFDEAAARHAMTMLDTIWGQR